MGITYEQAKQLKEAGFPVKYKNWECKECCKPYDDDEVGTQCVNCGWNGVIKTDIVFRSPTLSELIEACPKVSKKNNEEYDGFFALQMSEKGWIAGYTRFHAYEGDSIEQEQKGSTPEEAVAKLWLELNKK